MSQANPLQHAAAAARAGNPAVAKVHLQKAAEADPDNPAVWLWMGWLSDSPTSMIHCLEMLLADEQFASAAEAGIHFARTLAEFRAEQPKMPAVAPSEDTVASVPTLQTPEPSPLASQPSPAFEPVQEADLPTEVESSSRHEPSGEFGADDLRPEAEIESFAQHQPAPEYEELFASEFQSPEADVTEPQVEIIEHDTVQPTDRPRIVPEIIFDDEPDAVVGSAESPADATQSSFDQAPSLEGMDLTDEERAMWASFWEPGLDVEEAMVEVEDSGVEIEEEPAPIPESTHPEPQASAPPVENPVAVPAVEPPAPEPVVVAPPPPDKFRAARADWFSPGGAPVDSQPPASPVTAPPATSSAVTQHPPTNALPLTAAARPQWARPASEFDADAIPPTRQIAATGPKSGAPTPIVVDPVPQKTPAKELPPVWGKPSSQNSQPAWTHPVQPATQASSESTEHGAMTVTAPGQHAPQELTTGVAPGGDVAGMADESAAATATSDTVLVVDDSPTVRKLVAMTLEKRGYRVVTAFDGVAAIKEIAAQKPGLVLMDCNMPRLDGYQLCKLVKKHESTRHIPVVMLSGKDGMFDRLRGRLVGCAGYIPKPFVPETLAEAVARYLPPPFER